MTNQIARKVRAVKPAPKGDVQPPASQIGQRELCEALRPLFDLLGDFPPEAVFVGGFKLDFDSIEFLTSEPLIGVEAVPTGDSEFDCWSWPVRVEVVS